MGEVTIREAAEEDVEAIAVIQNALIATEAAASGPPDCRPPRFVADRVENSISAPSEG